MRCAGSRSRDGPGSFTGLRVGAAVAKALVQARGLPLWTAPSLLVRAAGVARDGRTVLAVADALRGELYAAAYRFDAGGCRNDARRRRSAGPRSWRRGSAPDRLVGEVPDRDRASCCERWAGRRDDPAACGRAARAFADRSRRGGRAARDGWRRVREVGAGVRPARRGAGTLGDRRMDAPYRIRSAVPADAEALVAIERRCLQRPVERGELSRGARVAVDLRPRGGGGSAESPATSSRARWPGPARC